LQLSFSASNPGMFDTVAFLTTDGIKLVLKPITSGLTATRPYRLLLTSCQQDYCENMVSIRVATEHEPAQSPVGLSAPAKSRVLWPVQDLGVSIGEFPPFEQKSPESTTFPQSDEDYSAYSATAKKETLTPARSAPLDRETF
jgi:hypothetical protein